MADKRLVVDTSERKNPYDKSRKYQIETLWERHREILRLRLLGHKAKAIASILNVTEVTVCNAINSNLGRRHLALMSAARDAEAIDTAKEIDKMVPKAIKIYDKILDGDKDVPLTLQAKVASEVIDRKVPKVTRSENVHAHFTSEEIDEIKKRAVQSGIVANDYQEAEFEEVASGP